MKTPRDRLTRASAEQLLAQPTGDDRLSRLLAAVSAPARPEELSGAAEALAVLRATTPTPATEEVPLVTKLVRKAVAAPAITAAAVGLSVAGGGIAVAASTGALPGVHPAHPARPARPAQPTHPAHPAHPGVSHPASPTGTPTTSPRATPSPSLTGLCKAWPTHENTHGAWSSSTAFTALVTAAGGQDGVTGYCQGLLGTPEPHPTHPATPTRSAHPTHPAHRAHPTHPASPTHPAHPAHP
ncbi:MAG: hypothetical protein JOZ82_08000, partial [Marmoricola sp.]|nr:hypothetical protein [Marmoricola sp.]